VLPHQRTTIFHGYPDDRHRGRFVDGDVRLETVDGEVVADSAGHRRTFVAGSMRCISSGTPSGTITSFRSRSVTRRGVPEGVDVVFPDDVPTHCRRQQIYFGADGRIVRHDYVAEVVARLGRRPLPFPVLCIQFGE